MRNVIAILGLVLSIALALVGCSRPATETSPAAEQAEETQIALVCPPGERRCLDCNGNLFCARRCPFECPAPVAPQPEDNATIAELTPAGQQCGGVICGAGLSCCNPSCNICTPKGVECTQQSCN
jgi:hypothetical protein